MIRNILDVQREAAIRKLDVEIARDWAGGYCTDAALDRRLALMRLLARK